MMFVLTLVVNDEKSAIDWVKSVKSSKMSWDTEIRIDANSTWKNISVAKWLMHSITIWPYAVIGYTSSIWRFPKIVGYPQLSSKSLKQFSIETNRFGMFEGFPMLRNPHFLDDFHHLPPGIDSQVPTRWCPSSLAKLVNITPITWVYGRFW